MGTANQTAMIQLHNCIDAHLGKQIHNPYFLKN